MPQTVVACELEVEGKNAKGRCSCGPGSSVFALYTRDTFMCPIAALRSISIWTSRQSSRRLLCPCFRMNATIEVPMGKCTCAPPSQAY